MSSSDHMILTNYINAATITPMPTAVSTTPTTPTANNSNSSTPNASSRVQQKNPKLYKTELCRSWMENGRCNYGERCQYAHGEREKRPVPRHPKYKTEPCQSYHKTGYCPYGPRCHFVHNESPAQIKALILANEQALSMVQEFAGLGDDKNSKKLLLTSSSSATSLGAYGRMSSSSSYGIGIFQQMPHKNSPISIIGQNHQFLGKAQSFGSCNKDTQFGTFYSPPINITQPQRRHFVCGDPHGMSYPGPEEGANFTKNLWSNNFDNICNQSPSAEHQRPKTLDLMFQPSSGSQSKQISPIYYTPLDEFMVKNSQNGENIEDEHPHTGETTTKADELSAQQLLGNLCSSDDEYSRSSIVSSTIDSGNESPLAPFEDDQISKSRIQREKEMLKEHQTASSDDPQQRRSSDGENATQESTICAQNSTASSSMASLISSSSSNSQSAAAKIRANSAQKIRLPVFERLSLNQI